MLTALAWALAVAVGVIGVAVVVVCIGGARGKATAVMSDER